MKKGHIVEQTTNDLLISGLTKFINNDEKDGYDYWKDIARKLLKVMEEGTLNLDSPFESIIFSRDVLAVIREAFRHIFPNEAEHEPYKIWWDKINSGSVGTDLFEFSHDANGVLTRKEYKISTVGYLQMFARRVKVDFHDIWKKKESGDDKDLKA